MRPPNNLEVYRRALNIQQTRLGIRCGVSQPRISNIESGNDPTPPKELLAKIAKKIKFPGPPEELLMPYVHGKYDNNVA